MNYGRRRQILQGWSIGPAEWTTILRQASLKNPGNRLIPDDSAERQHFSARVWAQITQGEYSYAPRPIRDQQTPAVQRAWRHQYPATPTRQHPAARRHLALEEPLAAYAEGLATKIDTMSIKH